MTAHVLASCAATSAVVCFPPVNAQDVIRERVKKRMRERDMNQKALARAVNRSAGWASNFLRGKKTVPLKTLEAIAEKLGTTVSELTGGTTLGNGQGAQVSAESGGNDMLGGREKLLRLWEIVEDEGVKARVLKLLHEAIGEELGLDGPGRRKRAP